jgi:hypothetical protein
LAILIQAAYVLQAPKSLPPAVKQQKILDWIRSSQTAHSIKDLEKILPGVASINGMQVKDYIQALTDENLIRVEKIGSGNWYWSFASEIKKSKEKVLAALQADTTKINTTVLEIDAQIQEEELKRENGDDILDDKGMDRMALLETHDRLLHETETLQKGLANYSDNEPVEILKRIEETKQLRESADRWTTNIESIESFLLRETGNDRAKVAGIMEQECGEEYTPGEGLKDL